MARVPQNPFKMLRKKKTKLRRFNLEKQELKNFLIIFFLFSRATFRTKGNKKVLKGFEKKLRNVEVLNWPKPRDVKRSTKRSKSKLDSSNDLFIYQGCRCIGGSYCLNPFWAKCLLA